MATKEYLQKRVEGREKEIEKLEKKLERILKAKESNYEENNPYMYDDSDLRRTLKDLESARKGLEKYQKELIEAVEKEGSRDVKVIIDFLIMWKEVVYSQYMNGFAKEPKEPNGLKALYAEKQRVRELIKEVSEIGWGNPGYEEAKILCEQQQKILREKSRGYYRQMTEEEKQRYRRKYDTRVKVKDGEYEWLKDYANYTSLEEASDALRKNLDKEAVRKYDSIIEKTNSITGKIIDASGLEISANQELNGFIIGEKGTARVYTVGAGGYNVQCYHFRTYITPIKEKNKGLER